MNDETPEIFGLVPFGDYYVPDESTIARLSERILKGDVPSARLMRKFLTHSGYEFFSKFAREHWDVFTKTAEYCFTEEEQQELDAKWERIMQMMEDGISDEEVRRFIEEHRSDDERPCR